MTTPDVVAWASGFFDRKQHERALIEKKQRAGLNRLQYVYLYR
jgi:hypothetical protein